jgi:hypothetical protein
MAAEGGGTLFLDGVPFDTGGESWSRVDNVNADCGSSGEGERRNKEHGPRAEDLDNALFRSLRPSPRSSSKTPFGPLKTQARVRVTHPPLVCGQATGNAARGEADTAAGF